MKKLTKKICLLWRIEEAAADNKIMHRTGRKARIGPYAIVRVICRLKTYE